MLILKKNYNRKFSLAILFSLLFLPQMALSQSHYLQPGQSKTINLSKKIRTVFIAKDSVANYEIIGENSLIVYAKSNGQTSLVAYDDNDDIILDDTFIVDPVLSQVVYRIKHDFPNSNINITKYASGMNGERFTYVVSGNVPDTETKRRVLEFIGTLVGEDREIVKVGIKAEGGDGPRLEFLDKQLFLNIIDKIEVIQETQVNVKLTFVEVSKDFTNSLGIEWQGVNLAESGSSGSLTLNTLGQFTLLGLKKGFDIHNIITTIRAINNDKLAKVLAEPNLSVLSGESASFLVGGEIPVITSGDNDSSAKVSYKEYGIKLLVGAKVHNNKRVRLFIADEFSSVAGSYQFNNFNVPTLRTRKTSSTIDIADGDSFVIAGLISEQDEEALSKIPFLGDIPILGALARSTAVSRGKTELIVFATVNIVNPQDNFEHVELPIFERTEAVNLFFNVNNNMEKQHKQTLPLANESEKFVNYMGFIE